MTQAAALVVRRQIVVHAPIDRAFATFTERFGDFKPPEHNLLGVPIAQTVFDPEVGGHITDRGVDGSECRWSLGEREGCLLRSCNNANASCPPKQPPRELQAQRRGIRELWRSRLRHLSKADSKDTSDDAGCMYS